jgi:hypothetical protein
MSNQFSGTARALPDRPNLRHLKDQAKDLLKSGNARALSDAQLKSLVNTGSRAGPN